MLSGLLALFFLCLAVAPRLAEAQPGGFDYYLLSLSYAPDFCAQPGGVKSARECGAGRHVGFVVHGLWPQSNGGRGPSKCAPAQPAGDRLVRVMLHYFPDESLIQHEWATHGTCTGLSQAGYFAAVRKARDAVAVPPSLAAPAKTMALSPANVLAAFSAANPSFPKGAFAISCYRDGELQEARVCFDKGLSPRPCGSGAGFCRARVVSLLPAN
ncbi:MAG: ribonuclease T2 family protein [Bryobacteraceae bacterium]